MAQNERTVFRIFANAAVRAAPNRTSRQESRVSGRNLKIIAKSSVTMLISNAKWMARANALPPESKCSR